MTVFATSATLNGKQVRTGDFTVAVKFVGAHIMRVEIWASCRTANGAKLFGFTAVFAIIVSAAAAIIVSAAHYYLVVCVTWSRKCSLSLVSLEH